MLDLNDFHYFVQIVDRGGFTAAGQSLKMPKSTLSHRMQQLEAGLGVRLLNRTSRQIGMTDAGREFYRYAATMLRQAEEAESAVRQRLAEPSGTVRFTTSVATAQHAMRPMVIDFLARYPKVSIVEHATDRTVDIISENFDVAIRAHSQPLPDSTLVQRTLAPGPWFLFAGANYLREHGTPSQPEDLKSHQSLFVMRSGVTPSWRLRHAESRQELSLPLVPRLLSDDMVSLKDAACAGLGIVALPAYLCRDELRSGELVHVLPEWLAGDSTITALIPYRTMLLPAVRAFIDHLAVEFPKALQIGP